MNLTPKSVFTGKGSNGEKITMFEWDFNTWAGFEFLSHLSYLVIGLLLSAISSPLLLILCIANYNGRAKVLYVVGMIISAFFIYDCNHGWLVTQVINFFFDEGGVTFLYGVNIASFILFGIFLVIGIRLHNFIEDLTSSVEARWVIFICLVLIIAVAIVVTTASNKNKGWVKMNINTESPSAKQERLEYERVQDLGGFKTKEEQDKYWEDLEKRCGENRK
jgi:hypothetical protein